jgi:hypothetical protein
MLRWGAVVDNEGLATTGESGEVPDHSSDEAQPTWASAFPADELDELRNLLSDGPPATAEGIADLLDAVGAKAVRLRTTMLRMVAERLSAAEDEAAEIRRAAFEEATRTRQDAIRVMSDRLEEAEGAAAAIREAALAEDRRAKRKALPLLTRAATQVESLRDEIARLFDAAEGVVPSLSHAAEQVRHLIADLEAPHPEATEVMESPPVEAAAGVDSMNLPGPTVTSEPTAAGPGDSPDAGEPTPT